MMLEQTANFSQPLLHNRPFRTLWSARFASLIGDGVYTVAVFWLALQFEDRAMSVALIAMAQAIAYLIVAPIAGALVDRMQFRRVMMLADIVRAVLVALVPLASYSGLLSLELLVVLSFLIFATSRFFDPAERALLPSIVESEQLFKANSAMAMANQFALILGPLIGGVVIAAARVEAAYWMNSATFVISFLALASLPRIAPTEIGAAPASGALARLLIDLKQGVGFIRSNALLRDLFAIGAGRAFAFGPIVPLLPFFLREEFGSGASTYGALLSIAFVGSLLGTIVSMRWGALVSSRSSVPVCTAILGAAVLGFALSPSPALGVGPLLIGGAAISIIFINENTIIQTFSPPAGIARVYGAFSVAWQGVPVLALFASAAIADRLGPREAYVLSSVLMLGIGLGGLNLRGFQGRTSPMVPQAGDQDA